MNRIIFLTVSLLFCLSWARAEPKNEIRMLEDSFNSAYAANDLEKYFSYFSADAVLMFPNGRTDVPKYKKQWTKYVGDGNRIELGEISDYHIRLTPQGDAAIVSYKLRLKTRLVHKSVLDERCQETDVWFKADGTWKVIFVHFSYLTNPEH